MLKWKNQITTLAHQSVISWLDIIIVSLLIIGGFFYLRDVMYWSLGFIGESPYGDAGFWWDGALHVAKGIFQDNPGKGYRPGYFLFTGLTLPVLGNQFQQYYHYFLLAFLTTSALFYLALRKTLGQLAAICGVAMLIFNPYTAEWLSTSTTDSTGLLLTIAALACLIFGVNHGWHRPWLIAFGILFAIANLTRPLTEPFIGIVFLAMLIFPKIPIKKRIALTLSVLLAFCIPTLLWISIQKLTVDEWSISQNDASALYAASDPQTQVWTPDMYEHINKLVLARYHKTADLKLQNKVFWQETLANYLKYSRYHLNRILPHTWTISQFSPATSRHGTDMWQRLFLAIIAIGMGLFSLKSKKWLRALIFFSVVYSLYSSRILIPYLTIAGALLALQFKRIDILLLSCYWWTGVAALYLTGATGGPPLSSIFYINALGYRLGAQVFFAGDLLAAFSLVWLAYVKYKDIQLRNRPSLVAGKIVLASFAVFFVCIFLIYSIGTGIVIYRTYVRSHTSIQSYPDLTPILNAYQKQNSGHTLLQGKSIQGGLDTRTLVAMPLKNLPDVLLTGEVSPFIWRFAGQSRSELVVYVQNNIHPSIMGPRSISLEMPMQVYGKKWIGTQGAFIIRSIPNKHTDGYFPYYLTYPTIRAFIPLTRDKKQFDIAKIQWFPIIKNAMELETDGELQFNGAKITWSHDSGAMPFQRRFQATTSTQSMQLTLNIKTPKGIGSTLNFSYENNLAADYQLDVSAVSKNAKKIKLLPSIIRMPSNHSTDAFKNITLTLPPDTEKVNITFNHLSPGSSIWFYEFNLSAMDFIS